MTLAESLHCDDGSDRRFELVAGLPIERLLATEAHGELTVALAALVLFGNERRAELRRRTADGWRIEDLIGQATLELACCASPIPLDAPYADLLSAS